jgi:hypothetical protein
MLIHRVKDQAGGQQEETLKKEIEIDIIDYDIGQVLYDSVSSRSTVRHSTGLQGLRTNHQLSANFFFCCGRIVPK